MEVGEHVVACVPGRRGDLDIALARCQIADDQHCRGVTKTPGVALEEFLDKEVERIYLAARLADAKAVGYSSSSQIKQWSITFAQCNCAQWLF